MNFQWRFIYRFKYSELDAYSYEFFFPLMTDTTTTQTIELSSWITLYIICDRRYKEYGTVMELYW